MSLARRLLVAVLGQGARRLRFPWLLLVTATLFVVDVLVPDLLPFIDEILLGLVTLVLANLKDSGGADAGTSDAERGRRAGGRP